MTERAAILHGLEGNEMLWRGGFGDVYMGILASNNDKPVAVKILHEDSRQGDSEFLNEVI